MRYNGSASTISCQKFMIIYLLLYPNTNSHYMFIVVKYEPFYVLDDSKQDIKECTS